jgi:hypothetical protein
MIARSGRADDRAAGRAALDGWKHDRGPGPFDLGSESFAELALAAVVDSLEAGDRVADLWEILSEQVVGFEFGLDRLKQLVGGVLAGSYERDETASTGEHGPDDGDLADRGLAGPARECEGMESALDDGSLQRLDQLQVVGGELAVKPLREIRGAEFEQ